MALVFDTLKCNFAQLEVAKPQDHEALVAVGSLPGHSRKIITISCYIPPGLTVPVGNQCLDYITDVVLEMKRKYKDASGSNKKSTAYQDIIFFFLSAYSD